MEKFVCETKKGFNRVSDFCECEVCGNHICAKQAKKLNFICPHCYSRLHGIS